MKHSSIHLSYCVIILFVDHSEVSLESEEHVLYYSLLQEETQTLNASFDHLQRTCLDGFILIDGSFCLCTLTFGDLHYFYCTSVF